MLSWISKSVDDHMFLGTKLQKQKAVLSCFTTRRSLHTLKMTPSAGCSKQSMPGEPNSGVGERLTPTCFGLKLWDMHAASVQGSDQLQKT
ncbi:unnamed protein product [Victoria cruziana]